MNESEPKPPKKKRAKVIQDDDDDEAEWNQDDLEDSGGDDGSAYEVNNKLCTCLSTWCCRKHFLAHRSMFLPLGGQR